MKTYEEVMDDWEADETKSPFRTYPDRMIARVRPASKPPVDPVGRLGFKVEDLWVTFSWWFKGQNGNDIFLETSPKGVHVPEDEMDDFIATGMQIAAMNFPGTIRRLSDILKAHFDSSYDENKTSDFPYPAVCAEDDLPIYVATNTRAEYGAACIFYPGMLDKAAEMLHGNFYIIPSSIHEMLLVPACCGLSATELVDVVHDVNQTQAPEEVLSDSVYFYNADLQHFFLVATYFEKPQK